MLSAGGEGAPQYVGVVEPFHLDQLVPSGMAAYDRDQAGRDAQPLCEQLAHGVVRPALDGRSGHAHHEPPIPLAHDLVPPGAGLNPHLDPAHRASVVLALGRVLGPAGQSLELDRVPVLLGRGSLVRLVADCSEPERLGRLRVLGEGLAKLLGR
jgi:hypothetical protein